MGRWSRVKPKAILTGLPATLVAAFKARFQRAQKPVSTGSCRMRASVSVLRLSQDSLISTIGTSFP